MKQFILDRNASSAKGGQRDTLVSCKQAVEEYIMKQDWRINANANTDYSNAGLINNSAGKIIANYWLDSVYSSEEGLAHRHADYHIHDLDCLTGYCAGWSLRVLLDEGFNGVAGKVSSRAPRHFREALGQMSNFLGILQSEWAGAQAFSSFDTYLAPYVFKDKLPFVEIKKAVRQFVYNLNVPARWGQSPFTNITLDVTVPPDLKDNFPTANCIHLFREIDDPELIAEAKKRGVESLEDMTYKHFQKEMELIDIAYYEVMTEGDSHGQPFTFPIPTVNVMEDFNWDSDVAKALFENTAKIGSSYFQNFIGSQYMLNEAGEKVVNPEAYAPHAVRSMCCRLQLDLRELLKRGNGLFGSAEMTGSIGVVTINMARLGYRFKDDMSGLMQELERLMSLAKSTLEKKRNFVQKMYDRGLFPYTKRYLPHFRNHFSTIGVNGMNEMVRNFTNDAYDITDNRGAKMCLDILDFMRIELKKYQEETGHLYNLEATPAEGTTYRFAKEDKKYYPNILQAGFGENIYYTNSTQLPVGFTDDPFEALTLQDSLQCKYTGGTVLHLYMNEKISSGDACKRMVKTVIEKYRLPYITITPVFSVCEDHGYLKGEQPYCPTCQKQTMVWTRVMGYHRPVASFNLGKKGEHSERLHFKEDACGLPLFNQSQRHYTKT
ncbi:MAG: ribonucleoside triphosphate reductase [Alphaproteobacteria bacterium RIFCSPLOWO2_01_FULL_40_26]|nr:MAG: ribonucleoside triphosphate reductase [Alphaproteobacteria bacterium RIFCSPHIGHO2_02_FULL_40_34]OFW87878.1 MAG: ribonucleoside triphosphate reductase [Alphaproteobacteria bacterium RIFCSPHIGHO2_01_FULL_40_8]OFW95065.1 MAG: ribonucleoside triphosphate reductase [Alphaproteobacteria bacterium RIFCSPLOWO2_01_FULL_40_26]OFX10592.1 MAG: ribonucleoside triphosphate reductase [Alphaproteobacteria bacterium RIFCSPLOWO2_02_FULL_40_19]OFX12144.1 MAG: ribonucleoside triphosphate reductase [Alphapr